MTLTVIRSGVVFNDPAAQSIKRIESQRGQLSFNRTTVPYAEQEQLYEEWLRGEHPEIPVVLNPKYSAHCYRAGDEHSASASDCDTQGGFWYENGWIIVNTDEPWHKEYRIEMDHHLYDYTPVGEFDMSTIEIITCPGYEAAQQRVITNGNACMTVPAGWTIENIQKGITYRAYDTNNAFLNEIAWTWQLGGMSLAAVEKGLKELTAKVDTITDADIAEALKPT